MYSKSKFFYFIILSISLSTNCSNVNAQKVDNLASFRGMSADSYLRIHYDNDYFTTTDENYTQGIQLELLHPLFYANPVNALFLKLPNAENRYGLAIEHNGFTPDDIKSQEIQVGDRPFAAAIMIKSFVISKDTIKGLRAASSLSTGVIGPVAFGYEMQKGIHQAINGAIPGGWRNQINNDLVLNYRMTLEKEIHHQGKFWSLKALSPARVGTYFTNFSLGFTTNFGLVPKSLRSTKQRNKVEWYLFAQPQFKLIGYDATLQGGIFSSNSYFVSFRNIERFVFQANYGMVIKTKSLYLEYFRTSISKEFNRGEYTRWGGIKIGFKI